MRPSRLHLALPLCGLLLALSAVFTSRAAVQDRGPLVIERQDVSGSVSMLIGPGSGNIGLSAGPDGALLIDDQYPHHTEKILEQVFAATDQPLRFVINTHWHGDHTGGNANLGSAGVSIVAHDNVRRRMSTEQFMQAMGRRTPASPPEALPVVTFGDRMTFHWNGDTIDVLHVPNAHTDGDALVHFREANVIHMGDTYFAGMYPFIDTGTGGDIDGIIAAADRALSLCDEETKIIPGHGPLSTPADLRGYRDMLADVRGKIARMVAEGLDLDAIQDAKPSAAYDGEYSSPSAFIKPRMLVSLIHAGVLEESR